MNSSSNPENSGWLRMWINSETALVGNAFNSELRHPSAPGADDVFKQERVSNHEFKSVMSQELQRLGRFILSTISEKFMIVGASSSWSRFQIGNQ